MDLAEMEEMQNGDRNIICLLDLFSKKLWAQVLQSKHAENTVEFVQHIADTEGLFTILQTDNGTEFANELLSDWAFSNIIGHFYHVYVVALETKSLTHVQLHKEIRYDRPKYPQAQVWRESESTNQAHRKSNFKAAKNALEWSLAQSTAVLQRVALNCTSSNASVICKE